MSKPFSRAKLFRHGGSQAVRLPREFRLPGEEVTVIRTAGCGVLLEPLETEKNRAFDRFKQLAGSCPDLPEVLAHSTRDISREE